MTTNEPPNQLEWFIRARSGVDSGQWDWGIRDALICHTYHAYINTRHNQPASTEY